MNPITVFLTIACLAVGAALGAMGHLYSGVAVVIVAINIAAALKMANTWEKFVIDNPTALQLRAMNIIYETTKERGATILIPTSMADSMNPVVALALAGQLAAPQKANGPLPPSPNARKESVAAPQATGA